jgi:hypothetical protein
MQARNPPRGLMAAPHVPTARPLMAVDGPTGRPLMTVAGDAPSAEEVRALLWVVAGALALVLALLHSARPR